MASAPFDWSNHAADEAAPVQPIPLVVPTAIAFIGRTERGPLNEPVTVKSFDEYQRIFGGYCAFSFVAHAVQHFFWHGGTAAIVVRVANRATRARVDVPAGREVLRLQARNPGSREFLRVSIDYDRVEHDERRFNLVVQRVGRPGSSLVDDQELFLGISLDPADERYAVDALRDSELVRLTGPLPPLRPDATRARRPGDPIPYLEMAAAGSDGEDLTDYDVIGSDQSGTGLFALDSCRRVDLICIPAPPGRDLGITSFVAATRYCERRRALLIWDPPWSWNSVDAALLGIRAGERASSNALTYFPRVRPRADLAQFRSGVPACGVVAGVLASSDRHGVWHRLPIADAGLRGNLVPLLDLSARQSALLNRVGVNTLGRGQPGGAALQGNVTFVGRTALAPLWQRLDTRRLALMIVRSIEEHTRWLFGATGADAAAALETQVSDFLGGLQRAGALPGKKREDAFFVRALATPALETGAPALPITLRIGVALQRPAELVTYDFYYPAGGDRPQLLPRAGAQKVRAAS